MRGDEERVITAFCDWLVREGWTVVREFEFCDVYATRGDGRLYAEAKGRSSVIGLDVDMLYGQLLRRMPENEVDRTRFAVVVPERGAQAAMRVPARVRSLLCIDVYAVSDGGGIRCVEE